jgi:two-component system cell cycle response regulator DivK
MSKTIMIVEDDRLNARMFAELLRAQGFRVLTAHSGAEVPSTAREYAIDLILMDLQLPDVSGIEVTRRLKADEALRHIPVVAMTAYSFHSDAESARACGCDAYLLKPVPIRQVLETIKSLTGGT